MLVSASSAGVEQLNNYGYGRRRDDSGRHLYSIRDIRVQLRIWQHDGNNGIWLVYQFRRTVLPHLKRHFGRVQEDFAVLNILPARIFHCTL